jgi:hypothetical protein
MIVDDEHRNLHDRAQDVVLSITKKSFLGLPPDTQEYLRELAMFCGCSHVEWFSAGA